MVWNIAYSCCLCSYSSFTGLGTSIVCNNCLSSLKLNSVGNGVYISQLESEIKSLKLELERVNTLVSLLMNSSAYKNDPVVAYGCPSDIHYDTYNIELVSVPKEARIKCMKEIRASLSSYNKQLTLNEVKSMVDNAPLILEKDVPKYYAQEIVDKINATGAVAIVKVE